MPAPASSGCVGQRRSGWAELMRPFTENDLWPLLPAVATTLALCCVAVVLASHRDVGDGLLVSADVARPGLVRSSLAVRSRGENPPSGAWSVVRRCGRCRALARLHCRTDHQAPAPLPRRRPRQVRSARSLSLAVLRHRVSAGGDRGRALSPAGQRRPEKRRPPDGSHKSSRTRSR